MDPPIAMKFFINNWVNNLVNNSMHKGNTKSGLGVYQPETPGLCVLRGLVSHSRKWITGLLIASLLGCQGNVMPDFERIAEGMQVTRVTTPYHQHLVMRPRSQKLENEMHVYIEGDGRPWIKRFQVAKDPTPSSPLVLQLMQRDKYASLFLGRPCYFNLIDFGLDDGGCDTSKWTSARYSKNVVSSMINALRQELVSEKYHRLTLIGYSGGGTLAMLMAQEMDEVDQVITVAANLDIDAWTRHHHYSPLSQSLNPAHIQRPRPASQHHFVGSQDRVVPPDLNRPFLQRIGQPLTVIEGFDHRCCWAEQWPALLQSIK